MSGTFFESVGISNDVLFRETGTFNVVHQIGEKIDGSFINQLTLAHFLKTFSNSRENARVLLILTHKPTSHWTSILQKLGVNIAGNQAVKIIDLLREIYDLTKEGNPEDEVKTVLSVHSISNRCEEIIQTFKNEGSKKILVIIEDLTSLLYSDNGPFQKSEKEVIEFLFRLRTLAKSSFENEKCSMIINSLVNSPDVFSHSMNQSRFAQVVAQVFSPVTFEVSPLRTGSSPQVTGFIKVKCNMERINGEGNKRSLQFIKNFHFKLENSGVRATPL